MKSVSITALYPKTRLMPSILTTPLMPVHGLICCQTGCKIYSPASGAGSSDQNSYCIKSYMPLVAKDCCVLNSGAGSWAFEPLAQLLSQALGIEISGSPRRFNYLLHLENTALLDSFSSFIPIEAIRIASDKRLLATAFNQHHVPIPQTVLIETFDDSQKFLSNHPAQKWCLKFPTGCGARGHRRLSLGDVEPPNWPRPFVVQEFIELVEPEVYRTYCAGGELFGWVVRRFPRGSQPSPWVAHARGARYVRLPDAPPDAFKVAEAALVATKLWNSFGCVDLLCKPNGEWVALEVGTDGLFNHVDRE